MYNNEVLHLDFSCIVCPCFAAETTEPEDAAFAAIKLTGLGRVEFLVCYYYSIDLCSAHSVQV